MTSLNKSLKEAFKILLSVNSGNGCNGIKNDAFQTCFHRKSNS